MTPQSSASWRMKMPLPAPMDSVPAPDKVELDADTLDDLEVATIPRMAPVPKPAPEPAPRPEPPPAIPLWAVIASGALLFLAVATTVALWT